jgi:hypothetical protein
LATLGETRAAGCQQVACRRVDTVTADSMDSEEREARCTGTVDSELVPGERQTVSAVMTLEDCEPVSASLTKALRSRFPSLCRGFFSFLLVFTILCPVRLSEV